MVKFAEWLQSPRRSALDMDETLRNWFLTISAGVTTLTGVIKVSSWGCFPFPYHLRCDLDDGQRKASTSIFCLGWSQPLAHAASSAVHALAL